MARHRPRLLRQSRWKRKSRTRKRASRLSSALICRKKSRTPLQKSSKMVRAWRTT
uniref:Uncharacterized protein n=1 Tax=uncultured marine virus TaxID=186617 RepID=A0A0F7KZU4_9VIRU|nr:hypothetical protein [uncultured marine virus]